MTIRTVDNSPMEMCDACNKEEKGSSQHSPFDREEESRPLMSLLFLLPGVRRQSIERTRTSPGHLDAVLTAAAYYQLTADVAAAYDRDIRGSGFFSRL